MKRLCGHGVPAKRQIPMATVVAVVSASWLGHANAETIVNTGDWRVEVDTGLSYALGFRANNIDPEIGANPVQQNDEYKFAHAGNIITNRLDISSEFSAVYQKNFGVDVSYSAWKDFAYGDTVKTHPGDFAPGVPYAALSSSPDGHYGQYTNRFYNLGGELGNAFVFANVSPFDIPLQIKVGRFTEYWGNALFSGFQAISYGQGPLDIIKAVDSPGTEVKNLFLPRGQLSIHAQVTPEVTLGFQYAFEYRYDRFPEGGTFLGVADPFFIGPTSLEGAFTRSADHTPPNVDGNFGAEVLWAPDFLNGTLGFYARQFDDVAAYAPFAVTGKTFSDYHLSYARHVHLYGISLDRNLGVLSTGIEASIRQNTGLNSVAGGDPAVDSSGNDGARGNTFNLVANAIYLLTPTRLWQTGSLVGEIAWTRELAVTHFKQDYNALGFACSSGLAAGQGLNDGCASKDEVNLNIAFDPQWLQVFPGVDIDAPFNVQVGLHGNGQTLALAGTGDEEGSVAYSAAIHALYKQKYNVKIQYTGYNSPTGHSAFNGFGQKYYSSGAGEYMWNDKQSVTIIFSTVF